MRHWRDAEAMEALANAPACLPYSHVGLVSSRNFQCELVTLRTRQWTEPLTLENSLVHKFVR